MRALWRLRVKLTLPRIITRKELRQIVPYSPQWILTLEKREQFPKRIVIGPRRVGWRLSEVEQWLAERQQQFGGAANVSARGVSEK